jgi:hypothetical protein
MRIDQLFTLNGKQLKTFLKGLSHEVANRSFHSVPAMAIPLRGSMFRAEDTGTRRRYQHFVFAHDGCEVFINFWIEEGVITVRAHRFTRNRPATAMNLRRAPVLTDAEFALIE